MNKSVFVKFPAGFPLQKLGQLAESQGYKLHWGAFGGAGVCSRHDDLEQDRDIIPQLVEHQRRASDVSDAEIACLLANSDEPALYETENGS